MLKLIQPLGLLRKFDIYEIGTGPNFIPPLSETHSVTETWKEVTGDKDVGAASSFYQTSFIDPFKNTHATTSTNDTTSSTQLESRGCRRACQCIITEAESWQGGGGLQTPTVSDELK